MNKRKSKTFLFACVAILLVILGIFGVHKTVGGWITSLLTPVGRILTALTPSRDTEGPAKRVQDLEEEVARLLVENTRLKNAREEGLADTDLTTWLEKKGLRGEVAHVIGRSPEEGDQMLVLDRGTETHITKGAPVLFSDGVLLGTIEEVRSHRSIVLLVTSPRSLVAASVDNGRKTPGLIRGEYGLTMAMESIPQNEKVERGQAVVTSNLDERVPENLLIGTIHDVTFATGDVFQRATVLPTLDPQRAHSVVVVLNKS